MEVDKPDILHSRDNVDFGKGFYVTSIKTQAEKLAMRFKFQHGFGIISAYEFHINEVREEYRVLEFDGYTEKWLDFITSSRRLENKNDYDVVIGGVANNHYDIVTNILY